MTNVLITGVSGRMGKSLIELSKEMDGINIVAGIDKNITDESFPVYDSFESFDKAGIKIDSIVDFSSAELLNQMLDYAVKNNTPMVIATTGYSDEQLDAIKTASEKVAVFRSANMSLGINVIAELCKQASTALGMGYDVEIIEKHHNKKKDSPSGTALLLADEINSVNGGKYNYIYDRSGKNEPRSDNEIGIHGVRGGSIVGDHEVLFIGEQEIVTITHSAMSRAVFAKGALRAAEFIKTKSSGIYNMADLVKGALM